MKKRIALLIMILIMLIIPAGLFGLISSKAGSHWLLRKVFSVLPAQVSVAAIQGRLIDRVSLTDFHYQSDTETVAIKYIAFAWKPYELFSGTLKIVDVVLDSLNVSVIETKKPPEESGFNLNAELRLPVRIVIENFLLTDLQFHKGDFVQKLEKLQLALAAEGDQLKIKALTVNAKPIAATAQGQMKLGKGFAFNLKSDWRVNAEQNGLWQGITIMTGDINKLSFDNHLSSPFKVDLKGNLDDLQTTPYISTRADWSKVVWPISSATPQLKSEQCDALFFLLSYFLARSLVRTPSPPGPVALPDAKTKGLQVRLPMMTTSMTLLQRLLNRGNAVHLDALANCMRR